MDLKDKQGVANLSFAWDKEATLVISIAGVLTVNYVASIWHNVLDMLKKHASQTLIFDARNLTFTDSIGAVLILQLKKNQLQAKKQFVIKNSSPDLQKFNTVP